ncbi:MAG: hypothetical protein KGS45_02440 [Planctomycetes bacterium]|nr:hypothetical protein [Planctomycetota bacterium]
MKTAAAPACWTMWLCRGAAVGLIVAWVTTRLGWAQYYVRAFLYWSLEQAGWMDKTKGLGGQIAGYNYWREPIWLREVANLVCHLIVTAPLLLVVLYLWERRSGEWNRTLCGSCGGGKWNDKGMCAGCGTGPVAVDATSSGRKWFTPAGGVLLRAGVWSASAAGATLWLMQLLDLDAWLRHSVFLKLGQMLGGQVSFVGVMVVGRNGPFLGDGIGVWMLNLGYMAGAEIVLLAAAACMTVMGERVLVSRGVVKYRG